MKKLLMLAITIFAFNVLEAKTYYCAYDFEEKKCKENPDKCKHICSDIEKGYIAIPKSGKNKDIKYYCHNLESKYKCLDGECHHCIIGQPYNIPVTID